MTTAFTFLTASAGSGKTFALTTALSEAIARGARTEDGLRPHHIIATTFTKKAAAELVERTQQKLIDDGQYEAASEVEAALIGTVNSIAGRIVEMYAIDAGLSPEVRVLGEDEQKRAFAVALDPVIAEAERTHRQLLRRTGYDAAGTSPNSYMNTGESWVDTVHAVVEHARANRLGPVELRESCERSLSDMWGMLDSVDPAVENGQRERWAQLFSDCLATLKDDVADVEAHGGPGKGMKWKSDGASRVSTSFGNTVKSIEVLEYFDARIRRQGLDSIIWPQWMAMARLKDLRIPGREHALIGARPAAVFAPLADAILGVEADGVGKPGLLGCAEFRADIEALTKLVFDTASEGLCRYEDYKKQLGVMDFVDQEALAVDLVMHNPRVQESLRSRYRFLAVDEFQDTSPIQLELFLRMSELVEEVLWVGDPKQSIYGFRGAAPELMEAAVAEAGRGARGEGRGVFQQATVRPLTDSYRSSEDPVSLVNGLFTSVFSNMNAGDVALDIPASRAEERTLGGVRVWSRPTQAVLPSGARPGVSHARSAIATGVAELLHEGIEFQGSPLEPKDIAVLSRTGTGLSDIVTGLRNLGVPAVGPERPLATTREGSMVVAALALARDPRDTLALTELIHLLDDHAAHLTWFGDLGACETREERAGLMAQWREDPVLAGIAHVRALGGSLSPSELMLALTDTLNLPERVKQWSRVEERLDNLDALHTLARDYEEDSAHRGRGMSVSGLHDYMEEHAASFQHKHAPNAVLVSTVHQAKGLQWPVVVSIVPEKYKEDARDAVTVTSPAAGIDPVHPLDGRRISFVPKIKDAFPPFARACASNETMVAAKLRAQAEEARIQYVSLTRAKWMTILAPVGKSLAESVLCDFDPASVYAQVAEDAAWPGDASEDYASSMSAEPCEPTLRVEPAAAEHEAHAMAALRVEGVRIPEGYPGYEQVHDGGLTLDGVRIQQHCPWEYLPSSGVEDAADDDACTSVRTETESKENPAPENTGTKARIRMGAPSHPVPVPGEEHWPDATPRPLLDLWDDGPLQGTEYDAEADPERDSDELILQQIAESDAAAYNNALHHSRGQSPATTLATKPGTATRGDAWSAERSPLASRDPRAHAAAGALARSQGTDALSARFKASAVTIEPDTNITVRIRENLGTPLVSQGDRGWELVGEAVHAFLALPLTSMTPTQQTDAATRIAHRWLAGAPHLNTRVDWPATLVEAGTRWHQFLQREYTDAHHATEVPVSMWNDDAQVMEGWIDTLIELPDSTYVLVDHKTFPDPTPHTIIEHVRSKNTGQLATYASALEHSRGTRPAAALVHLPLSGFVVEVML